MAQFITQRKPKNSPVKFKNIDSSSQIPVVLGRREGVLNFILKDKLALLFVCVWILPLIFISFYTFFSLNKLSNQIPLFYSQIWGEGQLAQKDFIYLPIAGVFIIGLFNAGVSFLLRKRDMLYAYLLLGTSSIISILATITVFNIINLIT